MPKTLKIIIVTISVLATILVIYIAPRVIPYTPPIPNIVRTDQGSFELRFTNENNFTIDSYKEYESYAKDYRSRILSVAKDPNLVIHSLFYKAGEGVAINHIDFWVVINDNELFKTRYFWNNKNNKIEYTFYGFEYIDSIYPKYISLQDLLQKPEYRNYKIN